MIDRFRLWAVLLMLAGCLGVTHVHRGSIVYFPGGLKLDKDHATLTVAPGCAPGAECGFTQAIFLPYGAQFSNMQYACGANQAGGAYTYHGITLTCEPISGSSFALMFLNTTATDLSNTPLDLAFWAIGL